VFICRVWCSTKWGYVVGKGNFVILCLLKGISESLIGYKTSLSPWDNVSDSG